MSWTTEHVRVDQIVVEDDPVLTGKKMEAVISNWEQEGFELRGVAGQMPPCGARGVGLPQVMHLVFVKR